MPRSIASSLLHNARVFSLSYAVKDSVHNENKLYKTPNKLKKLLTQIKTDYQRHAYRGRKMPTNATPIREGVANLEEHHTLTDVEKMAQKIAQKMGVEILSISVHRDEGKDAENLNYHAHILFNYYDFKTHKMVHHFNADRIMQQVQNIVAEELEMERGVSKEITGIEHVPHQQYRHVAKQKDQIKQAYINTIDKLKSKIIELENLKPKITYDQAINYQINANGKITTIGRYIQELISKIKELSIQKRSAETQLSDLDHKLKANENKIDTLKAELNVKPKEIIIENPINEMLKTEVEKSQAIVKKWGDYIKKFTGLDISKDEPPEIIIKSVLDHDDDSNPNLPSPKPNPKPKP